MFEHQYDKEEHFNIFLSYLFEGDLAMANRVQETFILHNGRPEFDRLVEREIEQIYSVMGDKSVLSKDWAPIFFREDEGRSDEK